MRRTEPGSARRRGLRWDIDVRDRRRELRPPVTSGSRISGLTIVVFPAPPGPTISTVSSTSLAERYAAGSRASERHHR
ncbi:MAG: hypothetical protein WC273_05050, partial [Dehalococcoidia bacterium]